MALEVYLFFKGNCKEVLDFYTTVFDQPPEHVYTYADAPADEGYVVPEGEKNYIMHASMIISGSRVMFADASADMPCTMGSNISLTLLSDNTDDLHKWFDRLKIGGNVSMELQQTFWSKCYGMLTDKFGICWQFDLNVN